MEGVELIAPAVPLGVAVEVVQDVFGNIRYTLRVLECLVLVDGTDLFLGHTFGQTEGGMVFGTEGKHVAVADGIDDGIGVQLLSECLFGGTQKHLAGSRGIVREDGRAGETEEDIFLEVLGDVVVHLPELAAVAFVEDEHDVLAERFVSRILLDEGG